METLELPELEEVEQPSSSLGDEIDLAAFRLWREASRLENGVDEDAQPSE